MLKKAVPIVVVRRLPRYYRYLSELLEGGTTRISSKALSEKMNVTASQIRQDLNCFGGFGQQGYGYNVEELQKTIAEILGLHRNYTMIMIGAGNLGRAIANYAGFKRRGFNLIGIFDNAPELEGQVVNGVTVMHTDKLENFCKIHKPQIAALTIPKASVNELANRLDSYGVQGIWNFSHADIVTDRAIPVESVHLSDSLMTLSYRVSAAMEQEEAES